MGPYIGSQKFNLLLLYQYYFTMSWEKDVSNYFLPVKIGESLYMYLKVKNFKFSNFTLLFTTSFRTVFPNINLAAYNNTETLKTELCLHFKLKGIACS